MAVGRLNGPEHERDIQTTFTDLPDRVNRSTFDNDLLDLRVSLTVSTSQVGEKSRRNGGVQTYAQSPHGTCRKGARRCDGVIEVLDAGGDFPNEAPPSVGQSDATMATLK